MRIVSASVLFLMFSGCSAIKTADTMTAKNNFTGGKWEINQITGIEISASKAGKEPPYMDFNLAEKRISAFAGCNRMNAGFALQTDTITISQMIATKMACPDMEYEYALERLLIPGNYTFKENDDILILYLNGSKVLDFKRPASIQNK